MANTLRVLVTGGAGFIAANFIRHLLTKTAYEVISLDALTYAGNLDNLADVMSHERLSFVHGDIRDAELVRDVVAEVDVIVNAAAESHVEKSIAQGAREFVTTNVEGTQILLDAIREAPVERFILFSSSEVYGTAEYAPMDEEHPLNPRSPYAATKAGADRLAYSYFVTYGLPVVIVRPFNNYGPRQHPEKVIPRFVTQALLGEPLTIHGDGHASRDWLYVDDDAEAIEAIIAADLDSVAGEVLNVATGVDVSIAEVADLVLELLDKPAELKTHVPERPGLVEGDEAPEGEALLVLGAGPAQLGLLAAAREQGLFVIAVDRDPRAPGFAYADRRALLSTEDGAAVERLARSERVAGVIAPGTDWPVGIAARIPDHLRLPHPISPASAVLAVSKLRQRECFDEAGVPQPGWRAVSRDDSTAGLPGPAGVKAPDRQGERGLALGRGGMGV